VVRVQRGPAETVSAAADSRPNENNVYAAFAYNGAGRLVMESQKSTVPTTVAELDYYGGAAGTYAGFDRFGRVVDQKWVHGATVLDRYGYAYDANSNRLYRENVLAADRSEVYHYDMLDRLAGMDRGTLNEGKTAIAGTPAREEDWNLTQTGNWAGYDVAENGQAVLNQTRTNNKANEITGLSEPESQTQWVTPEYDARGNMITMPKPDSPASPMTCVYDAWNRMVQAKNADGTVIGTYAYDGLNHRITKTVGATIRHAYYNADWQLLETRKTTDPEAHPETLNPEYQFIWSLRYIDAPVLRDENKNGDGDCTDPEDERLFFTNDANMNVTALIGTDGTVLERYAYTPYGKPSFFDASWNPRAASAYDNAILYCGYYYDQETGLYHVRNRYLDSLLGRWLSWDRAGYSGGLGLCEYVGSMPTKALDPSGLKGRVNVGKLTTEAVVEEKQCKQGGSDSGAIRRLIDWLKGDKFSCMYSGYTKHETRQSSALEGYWIVLGREPGRGKWIYEQTEVKRFWQYSDLVLFGVWPVTEYSEYGVYERSYARAYYLVCEYECCNTRTNEIETRTKETSAFYERAGTETVTEATGRTKPDIRHTRRQSIEGDPVRGPGDPHPLDEGAPGPAVWSPSPPPSGPPPIIGP
jgi:RHS repeat-associated protein